MPRNRRFRQPLILTHSSIRPDVEVFAGPIRLHLHSTILRHSSSLFEDMLTEKWWRDDAVSIIGDFQHKFRLARDRHGDWDLFPTHQLPEDFLDDNFRAPHRAIMNFALLFKAMYHRLSPEDITTVQDAKALADLADIYHAVVCVRGPIESFLGRVKHFDDATMPLAFEIITIIRSGYMYKNLFLGLVRFIQDGHASSMFDRMPNFIVGRLYNAAVAPCRLHRAGTVPGCEMCDIAERLAEEFPWEFENNRLHTPEELW